MKWYWWLAVATFIILGFVTFLPSWLPFFGQSQMPNVFGYFGHCSYTPMSALMCWMIAGAYWLYGQRTS